MTWKAYLTGDPADLNALAHLFPAGSTPVAVSQNHRGEFYFVADELGRHSDGIELHEAAVQVLARLNGLACLHNQNYEPVALARRYEDESGHFSHVLAIDDVVMRTSVESVTLTGHSIVESSPSPAGTPHMTLANSNSVVTEVLTLLGSKPGWVELYKVYEIIRDDAKR